ncbi:MAG: amino acid permease [Endomicrobium sp.]|jgi:AAT family amino acid transporter|nr:amino acid permease [Endomicrobium sp.]
MEQSNEENLQRDLSERHVQLIAIGGAIGIGLFLASGSAIASAGPSLLLSYLLAGTVVYFVMRALGEVAVEDPVSGSFSAYAHKFISPCAGFIIGWTYWFMWVVTCMAEVTAIGIYCTFWWPELPQWIPALAALICIMTSNLFNVKTFGEFEFWFALIKIVTIIAIIAAGLAIIFFGFGSSSHSVGISNLYALRGGFFPFGVSRIFQVLGVAIIAFGGVEFIGITAGEIKNPEKGIPSSINKVLFRIILLYIGTLFVIMCIYPWMNIAKGAGVTESPFVSTFSGLGIKQAAAIINFVVITASFSSCNSGMFSNGRMLYNLALQKQAPQFLAKVNSNKIPANAIITSSIVALTSVVLNFVMPENLFLSLISIITFLSLWVWGSIVIIQMYSRRGKSAEDISKLKYPMLFYPYTNFIALIALAIVAVILVFEKPTAVIIASTWLIIIYCLYKLFVKEKIT